MYEDLEQSLSRADIDGMTGCVVVEFGANWCGVCSGFNRESMQIFEKFPQVKRIRVEDGKGKRLGRSFRVSLWPSFALMRDGNLVTLAVRPEGHDLRQLLEQLVGKGGAVGGCAGTDVVGMVGGTSVATSSVTPSVVANHTAFGTKIAPYSSSISSSTSAPLCSDAYCIGDDDDLAILCGYPVANH